MSARKLSIDSKMTLQSRGGAAGGGADWGAAGGGADWGAAGDSSGVTPGSGAFVDAIGSGATDGASFGDGASFEQPATTAMTAARRAQALPRPKGVTSRP